MDPTRHTKDLGRAKRDLAIIAVLAANGLIGPKHHDIPDGDEGCGDIPRKSGNGYGRRIGYREWTSSDYACKRKKADKRHARKKAAKLMKKKQKLLAGK